MAPAGLAVIERSKADGSWSRLDTVEDLVVPVDLLIALDANGNAKANFEGFPRSSKRLILEWIMQAKTSATRLRRINETALLAAQNLRANHHRQPKRPTDSLTRTARSSASDGKGPK